MKEGGKGKPKTLAIELEMNEELEPSESGKTLSVASTRGNKETEIRINGKKVYVGVNAYIYAKEKGTEEVAKGKTEK